VKNAANNQREEGGRRRSELAKIHLAKKRLALDQETYRATIARVCGGKTSAGDLDEDERGKLLDEFKRSGFIEGGSYTTSIADFDDREPQARLICCLWADLKTVRSASRFIGAGVSRFHQTCNEGGFDSMAYGAAGECDDREFEAMEEADRVSAEFDGTQNVIRNLSI